MKSSIIHGSVSPMRWIYPCVNTKGNITPFLTISLTLAVWLACLFLFLASFWRFGIIILLITMWPHDFSRLKSQAQKFKRKCLISFSQITLSLINGLTAKSYSYPFSQENTEQDVLRIEDYRHFSKHDVS